MLPRAHIEAARMIASSDSGRYDKFLDVHRAMTRVAIQSAYEDCQREITSARRAIFLRVGLQMTMLPSPEWCHGSVQK